MTTAFSSFKLTSAQSYYAMAGLLALLGLLAVILVLVGSLPVMAGLCLLAGLAATAGFSFGLARQAAALKTLEQTLKTEMADQTKAAIRRAELLGAIADSQPRALIIADTDGRIAFANAEAAKQVGNTADEMQGRMIDQVMRPVRAQQMLMRIRQARSAAAPVIAIDRIDPLTAPRFLQTYYIPLRDTGTFRKSVLITEDDITAVITERERRETMLTQLVDTFVAVIDRRDPYAAGHSLRVGQIAHAIAEEMALERGEQETAELAGTLMNFGKVLVPRAILTKTGTLEPDELRQVREAILNSADILSIINFELPVVPTLRQVLERVDGSGMPDGKRGEDILLTARIVAVANSFVAMVSQRAHRPGLPVDRAIASLMEQIGKTYDRRVVVALANYMENRATKLDWLQHLQLEKSDRAAG